MSEETRPELIDYQYIVAFFVSHMEVSRNKAARLTNDLLVKLIRLMKDIFVCQLCQEARGDCRCYQHGSQVAGKWVYKGGIAPWLCKVDALLDLDPDELQKLSPKIYERTACLIDHLRELPE